MTKSEHCQSTIASNFMLHLLNNLDREDFIKGSTARLRQRLGKHTSKAPVELQRLAVKAFDATKDKYKKKVRVSIGVIVEAIYNNHRDSIVKLCGNDMDDLVGRCTVKIQMDLPQDDIKASYEVADSFKEAIQKTVFEYVKEKK